MKSLLTGVVLVLALGGAVILGACSRGIPTAIDPHSVALGNVVYRANGVTAYRLVRDPGMVAVAYSEVAYWDKHQKGVRIIDLAEAFQTLAASERVVEVRVWRSMPESQLRNHVAPSSFPSNREFIGVCSSDREPMILGEDPPPSDQFEPPPCSADGCGCLKEPTVACVKCRWAPEKDKKAFCP